MALTETQTRSESASAGAADTVPKLLFAHAARRADRCAFRKKELGIWQIWTWAQAAREVTAFAAGLHAWGFRRGDKLAIIGDNRPRLYWAMAAAQCLGGVPVPVYPDSGAAEVQFALAHAKAHFAVAQDQEQVDKLLAVRDALPGLRAIVYDTPRGLRHYAHDLLASYDDIQEKGRKLLTKDPDLVAREAVQGKSSDVAVILYTLGTTDAPKGVMLTYDNMLKTAANAVAFDRLTDREEMLSYLPMAWVGDYIGSFGQAHVAGCCISCPESSATAMTDLREIGPTYFLALPHVWETILAQVMIRVADAGWLKRTLFRYFMDVARRVGGAILDGAPVSLKDRLVYRIGEGVIYGPLKNVLGMSRIRIAYAVGDAIGPDTFTFFRSLGINVKQLYGTTEASLFLCMQPDREARPDTVGRPIPDVEIKIADDGEILFRGPGGFAGYYGDTRTTSDIKHSDGWTHSGDVGVLDAGGHLRIVDRITDISHLNDGTPFAPKFLENKLKFFPYIREAVVFGAKRDYVTAIITIDPLAVANWAKKHGIASVSHQELAALDPVYDLIAECVAQVNRDLAADPRRAGLQIRRFLLLHKELDPDDGELTRMRTVRRRVVGERFKSCVEALYSDAAAARLETAVGDQDRRAGTMHPTLQIRGTEPVESP